MGIVDIVGSNKRLVIGETRQAEGRRPKKHDNQPKRAIMLLQQPERAQVYSTYSTVTVASLVLLPAC
jgi:hypothetical protein